MAVYNGASVFFLHLPRLVALEQGVGPVYRLLSTSMECLRAWNFCLSSRSSAAVRARQFQLLALSIPADLVSVGSSSSITSIIYPTLTTTAKLPLLGEAVLYWELAGN